MAGAGVVSEFRRVVPRPGGHRDAGIARRRGLRDVGGWAAASGRSQCRGDRRGAEGRRRYAAGVKQRAGRCGSPEPKPFATRKRKSPVRLHRASVSVGSPTWARTRDLRINSPSLYRLSYRGTAEKEIIASFSFLRQHPFDINFLSGEGLGEGWLAGAWCRVAGCRPGTVALNSEAAL
ncbi:protein of unknown function [Cupriavidus taiwanensis]|uniref:Uncharacterized protein n=1 Tax=Cupriavidus taiwanensis TaxID=164546 RepID=A0A9Q7XSD5_9BURK|nr:protein of unknown function [Cupriavidus taiwanensis]